MLAHVVRVDAWPERIHRTVCGRALPSRRKCLLADFHSDRRECVKFRPFFLTLADMHFHLQVLWIGEIAAISALLAPAVQRLLLDS